MKTQADIESMVIAEIDHFHLKNQGTFNPCYLWYTETTAERNGGIMAQSNRPGLNGCAGEWYPVTPEQIRCSGQDHVRNLLARRIIGQLPVLEIERVKE